MVVGVVDTIMAGRFGKEAVAAASLAGSIFFPFLLFLLGLGYGLTARVANEVGAKRKILLPQLLKESFVLNVSLGALFSLVMIVLSYQLHRFGQPPEICDSGGAFLRILSLGMIPIMSFHTLKQFAEGMGQTRYATLISVSSNIANIALIWVFTVHLNSGLNGIAWATLLARLFMPIGMFYFLYRDRQFHRILLFVFFKTHGASLWKSLLVSSTPIGLQMVIETAAFSFASIMAGWINTSSVAAHQIALIMAGFTFMACTGISAAATVTVGQSWGAGNLHDVREYGKAALLLSVLYMLGCAAFFILFRWQLPQLFIADPEVIALVASLLLVAAMFQLSDGIQVVAMGALRGIGDVRWPSLLVFIGHWMIGLPLGYGIGIALQKGVIGIWIGLLAGIIFVSLSLLMRFLRKSNTKKVHSILNT